ncbi:TPM domain-containing protein, partial [Tenacibaculum maritimum]
LKFVYDFESFFTKKEFKLLQNKELKLNQTENITFIIISDRKPLGESFIESTKITNGIFKEKYTLSNVMILKMSKSSREIAIAYANSLSNKINDSICEIVIKKILKPNFIVNEYYSGVMVDFLITIYDLYKEIINYFKRDKKKKMRKNSF